MADFSLYFELGWQHILDWRGYDHILFVSVLCGVYRLGDWRSVLVLVTAFTIGHSATLALSVLNLIRVPAAFIEFLIPVTIVLTALFNIFTKNSTPAFGRFNYLLTTGFGLIHGLGFSNYLKSLLGRNTNIMAELFSFNLGLEAGQLLVVGVILGLSFLVTEVFKAPRREWNLFLSAAVFGVAFTMALERLAALIR